PVGVGDTQRRTRLLDARRRDRYIRVVRKRFVDQLIERLIIEQLPPRIRQGDCAGRLSWQLVRQRLWPRTRIHARDDAAGERYRQQQYTDSTHLDSSSFVRSCQPLTAGRCISAARPARRSLQPAIQRKNSGTNSVAMKVAASMPPITLVPSECRLAAPAPELIASGSTPNISANEVM